MKEKIRQLVIRSCSIPFCKALFMPLYYQKSRHIKNGFGVAYEDEIRNAISRFTDPKTVSNKGKVRRLVNDILYSNLRFGTTPDEYFLMGFPEISDEERSKFLTDSHRWLKWDKVTGRDIYEKELTHKYNFYQLEKDFFKRKACKVENETDWEDFLALSTKAENGIFIKEMTGFFGMNAMAYKPVENEKEARNIFDSLLQRGKSWIVEERIIQSDTLAQWNPSSVNTIRIPIFKVQNGYKILAPFFRTGRKGFIIDNAGGGGIFACIDPETGIVNTDGCNENGEFFETHPDSGVRYKGFHIPEWDNLCRLAENALSRMTKHKGIAFDFAHTKDGWVLIEGNWGQFVTQYNNKIGLKEQFDRIMDEK